MWAASAALTASFPVVLDAPQKKTTNIQENLDNTFTRLLSFASSEVDKRRRSTEGASPRGNTLSCNTSPDSGIGRELPAVSSASSEPSKSPIKGSISPNPKQPRPPKKAAAVVLMPVEEEAAVLPPPPPPPVGAAPEEEDELLECNGPPRTPSPSNERPASNPAAPKPQSPEPATKDHFKKKFKEHWNRDESSAASRFRPKGKDFSWQQGHDYPPDFSRPPPSFHGGPPPKQHRSNSTEDRYRPPHHYGANNKRPRMLDRPNYGPPAGPPQGYPPSQANYYGQQHHYQQQRGSGKPKWPPRGPP
jgi:hypothetical protein